MLHVVAPLSRGAEAATREAGSRRGLGPATMPILLVGAARLFGLATALTHQGWDVRSMSGTDPQAVLRAARRAPCGVVVLDVESVPGRSGVDRVGLVGPLVAAGWTVLVAGAGAGDDAKVAVAIQRGAAGEIRTTGTLGAVLRTIKSAAAGQQVMTATQRHDWLRRYREYRQLASELATLYGVGARTGS